MSQPTKPKLSETYEKGNDDRHRLRPEAVGVLGILFFVLSAQAPLTGIAGALPLTVVLGNGAGAPGAYLAVGVIITIFAVGFIAMSRHVKDAGAFYAYIGKGLGRRTGIASSTVALWSYSTIQAAMYGLYGVTVSYLFHQYAGLTVFWWVAALVTMVGVMLLGALHIDIGAKVLAVLVFLEMSILLAFAVAVLFSNGGPQGLDPGSSFSVSAVTAGAPGVAIMFAIASMFGFESTAIYAEEAKDPVRTVPRATYLSVAVISAFFAFVTWMFISSYGASKVVDAAGAALKSGDSTGFVFAAVGDKLGGWTGDVLAFLLASSLLAGILAFHNALNRYKYSLGHHGALPVLMSKVNRHGAPYLAGRVQTVIAMVLVLPFAAFHKDPVLTLFSWFSGVAVLALLVLYVLTSIAVIVFFRRTRADARPWQTLIAPALSVVLMSVAAWLVVSNFTTLIGGSTSTAVWLVLTVPASLLVGLALSLFTGAREGRGAELVTN